MTLTWRETSPDYYEAETPTLRLVAFSVMHGLGTYAVSRKSDPHKLVAVGGVRNLEEAQATCEVLAGELA